MGKVISVDSKLRRDRARQLRRDQTASETRLWDALSGRRLDGWKWRRQVPVGPFIVDFLCLEAAVAVDSMAGSTRSGRTAMRGATPISGPGAFRCCGSGTGKCRRSSTACAGPS
jgi:very-short-patch-repair endonuclease